MGEWERTVMSRHAPAMAWKQRRRLHFGSTQHANTTTTQTQTQNTHAQDFGARDPFPAELESNFGEKVLGNWDTEHIIK